MKHLLFFGFMLISILAVAQKKGNMPVGKDFLKNSSNAACKCIDSLSHVGKEKFEINEEISKCIDKQVLVYQLGAKLAAASTNSNPDKNIDVNISDKNSDDYKKHYYEIQNYLLDNCPKLNTLISSVDRDDEHYQPKSNAAIKAYNSGLKENQNENWEQARNYFEKAVKEDPNFAYAWDNLGLAYRKLNLFDKAIEAYQKSLTINPKGKMPLQNLPVAYSYNKEYQKAIDAFENFDKYYPGDPEVNYGIGQIYYEHLKEYEKSLTYMCKAFNTYTALKSPYRADAERIIVYIYRKMKEDGKLNRFNEILAENNINPIIEKN